MNTISKVLVVGLLLGSSFGFVSAAEYYGDDQGDKVAIRFSNSVALYVDVDQEDEALAYAESFREQEKKLLARLNAAFLLDENVSCKAFEDGFLESFLSDFRALRDSCLGTFACIIDPNSEQYRKIENRYNAYLKKYEKYIEEKIGKLRVKTTLVGGRRSPVSSLSTGGVATSGKE
ncbi:MAG: hypothetical protein H6679_04730 [Epsilonproteobacteria bacterium]|nr:hypothetical protein [Campylobacterota bacterium]